MLHYKFPENHYYKILCEHAIWDAWHSTTQRKEKQIRVGVSQSKHLHGEQKTAQATDYKSAKTYWQGAHS